MGQQVFSEILNDIGFVFVGTVGQKDAYTLTDRGTLVLTDELGFAWEIREERLRDDQKCKMCEGRKYVSHLFAPQTLH